MTRKRIAWPLPQSASMALAACLPLLGACTVGPNWNRPTQSSPAAFPHPVGQPASSQPSPDPASPDWWDIFQDPQLSSLERRATAANLDVAAATMRVAESRAAKRIVGAERYPSVNANASYGRGRASPNGILSLLGTTEQQSAATVANGSPGFGPASLPGASGSPPFNLWQYGVDASWELDLWGRVRREIESANARVEASEDMRRGILLSVLAEVAQDYLQLRGTQCLIGMTQQNIDVAEHSLALTQLRMRNGAATNLDVANAKAYVSSIRARLPALQDQEARLENALSFLLGKQPRALNEELEVPQPIPPVPPQVPVGLPSELAERRPDIRAAEAQLHAATADIGVAVADFYPRITLGGSFDIQALHFSDLDTLASRQYGFGPSINVPIFQGGRLRGTLELRKTQQKQAALAYQRTLLHAWHEVDDALTTYNETQNQRTELLDSVKQSQLAMDIAKERYAQGQVDFLNVLTAQARLLDTQQALLEATTHADIALTHLYTALGGGWQLAFPLESPQTATR